MDRAAEREPDNIEIRTLRAYISFRLPETFFHRTASAIGDFLFLTACYEQDPSVFSTDFYRQLLNDLAEAYQTMNQKEEAQLILKKLGVHETNRNHRKAKSTSESLSHKTSSHDLNPEQFHKEDRQDRSKEAGKKPKKTKKGGISTEGINLYHKALMGDLNAAREAEMFFEEALERDPDNELLQAYHADSMSLVGRYAADTFSMFGNAIKAAKVFDSIINANPDYYEMRFMRAYHSFRLPEGFFKRTSKAIEDFKYLIEAYEQNSSLFPQEACWQLLLDLGVAYDRLNMRQQAVEIWEELLQQYPSQYYADMAQSLLNDDRISFPSHLSLSDPNAYFTEARRLHQLGAAGNRKAVGFALKLWEAAANEYPDDWTVQAYYGASLALAGRDSNDPQSMFGNGLRGLKMIKEALAQEGNNPEILRLKAFLLYALPEAFFHFTSQAIKDFQNLIKAYQSGNTSFSREEYEEILFTLGMAHQRLGNKDQAQKVWAQLLSVSVNPRYHMLINKGV